MAIGHDSDAFGQFSSCLQHAHIVGVLVRLQVNGQIALGGGGVAAHFAAVGFVPTGIRFAPGQPRVHAVLATVAAVGVAFAAGFISHFSYFTNLYILSFNMI